MIFRIRGHSLARVTTIRTLDAPGPITAIFEYWRYLGKHLLWVALSDKDGDVRVFDFNTESGCLRELVEVKVKHQKSRPRKVHHLGDLWGNFYYTGEEGKIMRLSLKTK